MDEQGRLVHGDFSDVHNYTCYGAEVLAVADGKVVGMLNDLDDQSPGKLPDPDTITIDTVDGNHLVLDIGGGYFAFMRICKRIPSQCVLAIKLRKAQI